MLAVDQEEFELEEECENIFVLPAGWIELSPENTGFSDMVRFQRTQQKLAERKKLERNSPSKNFENWHPTFFWKDASSIYDPLLRRVNNENVSDKTHSEFIKIIMRVLPVMDPVLALKFTDRLPLPSFHNNKRRVQRPVPPDQLHPSQLVVFPRPRKTDVFSHRFMRCFIKSFGNTVFSQEFPVLADDSEAKKQTKDIHDTPDTQLVVARLRQCRHEMNVVISELKTQIHNLSVSCKITLSKKNSAMVKNMNDDLSVIFRDMWLLNQSIKCLSSEKENWSDLESSSSDTDSVL